MGPASLIALARERVRAMESANGPAEAAISEEERAALRALGYAE